MNLNGNYVHQFDATNLSLILRFVRLLRWTHNLLRQFHVNDMCNVVENHGKLVTRFNVEYDYAERFAISTIFLLALISNF